MTKSKSKQENLEILAEIFDNMSCRKFRDRFVHCASCGEETMNTNTCICADCLDDGSDQFLKESSK